MNRRNVLLGLGAIATGGGALFGSGAFSSVEANRDVTLGVEADANANLGLTANNTNVANNTGGTAGNQLGINATAFNPDATTRFDAVFDITNNGTVAVNVAIESVSTPEFDSISFYADSAINSITSDVSDLSTAYVTIDPGATLTVGISADAADTAAGSTSTTVTIEARDDTNFQVVTGATTSGGTETS